MDRRATEPRRTGWCSPIRFDLKLPWKLATCSYTPCDMGVPLRASSGAPKFLDGRPALTDSRHRRACSASTIRASPHRLPSQTAPPPAANRGGPTGTPAG
jgi:hypothetical protein